MKYRKESYFQYLKLHSSDIWLNMKMNKKVILISILVILGMAISTMSISVIFSVLASIFLFIACGFGVILYVFPMTMHYKIFKRSSEQFNSISKYILNHKHNASVTSTSSKVSFLNRLNYYGESLSDIIDFDFQKTDIFETKQSIFLFPIRETAGKDSNIQITEYLPPVRFLLTKEENISGVYDIHVIHDFTKTVVNEKLVIEFTHRKYKNNVKLEIKR